MNTFVIAILNFLSCASAKLYFPEPILIESLSSGGGISSWLFMFVFCVPTSGVAMFGVFPGMNTWAWLCWEAVLFFGSHCLDPNQVCHVPVLGPLVEDAFKRSLVKKKSLYIADTKGCQPWGGREGKAEKGVGES